MPGRELLSCGVAVATGAGGKVIRTGNYVPREIDIFPGVIDHDSGRVQRVRVHASGTLYAGFNGAACIDAFQSINVFGGVGTRWFLDGGESGAEPASVAAWTLPAAESARRVRSLVCLFHLCRDRERSFQRELQTRIIFKHNSVHPPFQRQESLS